MAVKTGDRVRILIDSPTGEFIEGTVRVVQDEPGKKIGVELDNYVVFGHSLDGAIDPEKVDPAKGITIGKGWWTLEDYIEVL